jgi:hypothetical protein
VDDPTLNGIKWEVRLPAPDVKGWKAAGGTSRYAAFWPLRAKLEKQPDLRGADL